MKTPKTSSKPTTYSLPSFPFFASSFSLSSPFRFFLRLLHSFSFSFSFYFYLSSSLSFSYHPQLAHPLLRLSSLLPLREPSRSALKRSKETSSSMRRTSNRPLRGSLPPSLLHLLRPLPQHPPPPPPHLPLLFFHLLLPPPQRRRNRRRSRMDGCDSVSTLSGGFLHFPYPSVERLCIQKSTLFDSLRYERDECMHACMHQCMIIIISVCMHP